MPDLPNETDFGNVRAATLNADAMFIAGSRLLDQVNNRVAVVGDSIVAQNHLVAANQRRAYNIGSVVWAGVLTRQRFVFEPEDNYGVGGNTSAQILARLPGILSTSTAATIILAGGTNDLPDLSGIDQATSKANIAECIRLCRSAGRYVVLIPPRPRGDANFVTTLSATGQKRLLDMRDWCMRQSASGVYPVDSWKYLADPLSTTAGIRLGYTSDGLHLVQQGAFWEGVAIAETLGSDTAAGLFPYINVLASSNSDQYDAVLTPNGALDTNPMLDGSVAAVGTGATGNVATGWDAGSGSGTGLVRAYSKVNGKQQIVLSGTPTAVATPLYFAQNISASKLAIGDVCEAYVDVEVDAGMAGLPSLSLYVQHTDNGNVWSGLDTGSVAAAFDMPPVAWKGVIKTPRFTLTSTAVQIGITSRTRVGSVVSGTVRVGSIKLAKIPA